MTAERDALVLKMLRQTRTVSDDDATLEQKRQDAVAEARERLTGAARRRFDGALAYAELVYPQRDDNVPYTEGLPCGLIRRALLAIGSRITERGALHAAGDVSFLHKDELEPALNGKLDGETAAERASRRRAEHAWVLAHPGPLIVGPPPVPDPDLRGLPAAARRIMSGVLWAVGEELTPAESKASRGRQPARHRRVPRQLHWSCTRHQNGGGARPTTAGRRAGVPDDALELDRGVWPSGRAGYRRWRHAVTPVDHRTRARHSRGGGHRLRNRDTSRGTDGYRRRDHRTGADPLRVFGRARQITMDGTHRGVTRARDRSG